MSDFIAPNGKITNTAIARVITVGLSEKENGIVECNLPTKDYSVMPTDEINDLIAINAVAIIINAATFGEVNTKELCDYHSEVNGCTNEIILWCGYPKPPNSFRSVFKCYESFEELSVNLKYILLSANRKNKKARAFSRSLSDCLHILSIIRTNPGIRTQELSAKTELPVRTVQRHIAALQATGEWLYYDTVKHGWYLQYGISILFGDHLDKEDTKG